MSGEEKVSPALQQFVQEQQQKAQVTELTSNITSVRLQQCRVCYKRALSTGSFLRHCLTCALSAVCIDKLHSCDCKQRKEQLAGVLGQVHWHARPLAEFARAGMPERVCKALPRHNSGATHLGKAYCKLL